MFGGMSEESPAAEAAGLDPDQIRVPPVPEGHSPTPIVVHRLMAVPGSDSLYRLDEEEPEDPLTITPPELAAIEEALAQGDVDTARDQAEALYATEGLKVFAQGAVARTHLMEGDVEAARRTLEGLLDDDRLRAVRASLLLTEGKIAEARVAIKAALEQSPRGLIEAYTEALVLVAEGRPHEAQGRFAEVCRSAPYHAVARHQLGQLLHAAGDPARAGTLFEQAIEIAPGFLPPVVALAEMFMESRQYGEAMGLLGDLAERRPDLLTPRLMQLKVLLAVGELRPALELANALRGAAPLHPEVELHWAEAVWRSGDRDKAKEALEKLAQHEDVTVQVRALRELGRLSLAAMPPDFIRAVAAFDGATQRAPLDGELRVELAEVCFAAGDHQKGEEVLQKLLTFPSVDLGPLLNGAVVAQNNGKSPVAKQLAERALEAVRGTGAEEQIRAFVSQLG